MGLEKPAESAANRLLRRADQAAIAGLALFALAAISAYWISQAKLRGRLIDLDRSSRPAAAFRVDVNQADWPELIELPGLGETLARRIVAWRAAHGRFNSIDQLRAVSGVGPKRLESWRPYLRAIGPLTEQASLERDKGAQRP
ncbi:MAG TPA: helix-hairpin-helix domain-containing protein [Pirellulales bacterium]|jgi:competence protein ComEA|nr:helix-hairpin-helix domain-containing protein [Pirellulales bacterium]